MIALRMISGQHQNQALDLAPNTSLSLEINNPLLSRDVIPGSYSLPFTLPATAHNRKLLGFPERLDLAKKQKTRYEVVLYIEGMYWRRGELILRKVSNTSYSANFQTDVSTLKDKLSLNIKDLPHQVIDLDKKSILTTGHIFVDALTDGFAMPSSEDIAETIALSTGKPYVLYKKIGEETVFASEFYFTINGTQYNQDDRIGFQKIVRDELLASEESDVKMQYFATFIDDVYSYYYFFWAQSGSWETPMDITFHPDVTYQLIESAFEIYSVAAMADFNTRFADNALHTSDFVMPTFHNPDLLGDHGSNRALHNYYDPDDEGGGPPQYQLFHGSPTSENTYGLVPCFSLAYVLRKIETSTGINIQGALDDAFFKDLIFFNNHALNTFDGSGNPLLAPYINPANHLPDMSILDLLLELGKMFCLGYYYSEDDNILQVIHLPTLLEAGDARDMTTLASPKYEKDVADPADGAIFSSVFPDSDKMYKQVDGAELSPYTVDGGKEEIKTKISTTYTRQKLVFRFGIFSPGGTFVFNKKIPVTIEEGTLGTEEGDTAPRLLYYAGRVADSAGLYPYATSDGTLPNGNNVGLSSLQWSGPRGLFEVWWKEWYTFEQNRQIVSLNTYWSMLELLNHKHGQQYSYYGQVFLVRRLQLNISSSKGLLAQSMELDTIS